MEISSIATDAMAPPGQNAALQALAQVDELCRKILGLETRIGLDLKSFRSRDSKDEGPSGVKSFSAELTAEDIVVVKLELVRAAQAVRPDARELFRHLASLGDRIRIASPPESHEGENGLWVALSVKAIPLGVARSGALAEELKRIDSMARVLQAGMPQRKSKAELTQTYKDFSGALSPVFPVSSASTKGGSALTDWADRITEMLVSGISAAVVCPYPVVLDMALAELAEKIMEAGSSVARMTLPAVNSMALLDLAVKAPGMVAVPVVRLSMGSNPYEQGNEAQNLVKALSHAGRAMVFTGSMAQQQSVFAGGQGAEQDPLLPVACHVPEVEFGALVHFAVESAASAKGGLSPNSLDRLRETVAHAMCRLDDGDKRRLLPAVAQKGVHDELKGRCDTNGLRSYLEQLADCNETFAGLSHKPRVERSAGVQRRFVAKLCGDDLETCLNARLEGQEAAVKALAARFRTEIFSRPSHQPIRCLAIGTPGTGKSESASLVARYLEIPYIYIDAASMPDHYTALAQFYGSGRGIVGSHRAGRLEQGAKHHTGVLFEIADLDHAPSSVRSALADSFLQPLETGEAQSATGAMFSCANVIFYFSMNLPDRKDEAVRKSFGFSPAPDAEGIRKNVMAELKSLVSGAFMSRLGAPVVFDPLSGDALARILEKAVADAVAQSAKGLGMHIGSVCLEKNLGRRLLRRISIDIASFGARVLLERGRSLAVESFLSFRRTVGPGPVPGARVRLNDAGELEIVALTVQPD